MFNSAIVFDERFCLGWCDSQEGAATSAANLATQAPLPVRGEVGWNNNKCQALSLAPSGSFCFFCFFSPSIYSTITRCWCISTWFRSRRPLLTGPDQCADPRLLSGCEMWLPSGRESPKHFSKIKHLLGDG